MDPRLTSSMLLSRLKRPFFLLNNLKEERGEGDEVESSLSLTTSGELVREDFLDGFART